MGIVSTPETLDRLALLITLKNLLSPHSPAEQKRLLMDLYCYAGLDARVVDVLYTELRLEGI